jgi:hypothetical protein
MMKCSTTTVYSTYREARGRRRQPWCYGRDGEGGGVRVGFVNEMMVRKRTGFEHRNSAKAKGRGHSQYPSIIIETGSATGGQFASNHGCDGEGRPCVAQTHLDINSKVRVESIAQ